jgi:peptidoglycan/LPS O-acetylase OafA/YrhL
MNKEMSLYLDVLRFTAAMTVFLGHASGKLTGGFLWQLNDYLSASVMIFFVLSGYVIGFVCDTKEQTIKDYSVARVSRLSSVVVPAILLTIIFDYIGVQINPDLYYGGPWPEPQFDVINYVLSLFLLQNIWGMNLNPGINAMFWSLSYELMFYIIFAVAFYFKGIKRFAFVAIAIAISGPDIVLYFPIWLLGLMAYHLTKNTHKILEKSRFFLPTLFILSALVLIILTPYIENNFHYTPDIMITNKNILADYIYAIIFTINLIAAPSILPLFSPVLKVLGKYIVSSASLTFSLYLFHRPLIQFFATFNSETPDSLVNRITVIGGTILVTIVIGHWAENQKHTIKRYINKLIVRLS